MYAFLYLTYIWIMPRRFSWKYPWVLAYLRFTKILVPFLRDIWHVDSRYVHMLLIEHDVEFGPCVKINGWVSVKQVASNLQVACLIPFLWKWISGVVLTVFHNDVLPRFFHKIEINPQSIFSMLLRTVKGSFGTLWKGDKWAKVWWLGSRKRNLDIFKYRPFTDRSREKAALYLLFDEWDNIFQR